MYKYIYIILAETPCLCEDIYIDIYGIHSIKSICFAMRRIASMKFIYLCTYVDFAIIRTFIYFLFLFINESKLCICFILFLNSVLFFTI